MSHFQKNLLALQPWTPTTAVLLSAASIPADYEPAFGTDATRTFRRTINTPPRRIDWLGHTSMPRASAISLIHGLNTSAGNGNGLGLSIGSAFEWSAFADKLARNQALFVYEPDPALLRMALDICDLAHLLASGKIILLAGPPDSAAADLSAFLARHIGFEPPTVLQPLPTIPSNRRNPLLSAGELLVRRAVHERHTLTQQIAAEVEAIMSDLSTASLILALTPRYVFERPLIPCIPTPAATLFIDDHASASLAIRLRSIADHRPQKIISDLFRNQLLCIPHTIAVETWIPPLIGPAFWNRLPEPSTLAPGDRIIIHSGHHHQRLLDHAIPDSQIHPRPLPPPAHPHSIQSLPQMPRTRVAIIADLSPLDPTLMGIELPTHLAVFAAASELITQDFLTVHPAAAPDILRRALARANIATTSDGANDPALREPILQIIRDVLIPTLPLLTLARHLIAHHIPLRLIGDWQGLDAPSTDTTLLEPFPKLPGTHIHWNDVALLAHLSPTGIISPFLLDAISNHIPIIAPQHPTDHLFNALPTLLTPNTDFAHPVPSQFLSTLKSLLQHPSRLKK